MSEQIEKAIAFAREHGSKLHRHTGGFWSTKNYVAPRDVSPGNTTVFKQNTITALVKSGRAEYSRWANGDRGPFGVEVTLKDGA